MHTSKHILVIDDDAANAGLLQEFLTEQGFDVAVAGTAGEGRQRILGRAPDLIVLDLYLPDMMGSDLCAELRSNKTTSGIPIILCTAHQITHGEKMKGFRAGVDDYLVRPFELAELLARIEAVLRRASVKPKAELLAGIQAVIEPTAPPVFAFNDGPSESAPPSQPAEPFNILKRTWDFLNFPARAFAETRDQDFFIALILVLATPVIGSLSKIFQKSLGFDAWIGHFSLGMITHLLLWFGTAGLLHMAVPFLGLNVPVKKALTITGAGWAPRLVGALCSFVYGGASAIGISGGAAHFSTGIDLVPGLPASDGVSFLGNMGLFDLWGAWITLTAVWWMTRPSGKRWNPVTILIGIICFASGALTHF